MTYLYILHLALTLHLLFYYNYITTSVSLPMFYETNAAIVTNITTSQSII